MLGVRHHLCETEMPKTESLSKRKSFAWRAALGFSESEDLSPRLAKKAKERLYKTA